MESVHEYSMDYPSRGLAVIINNRHFLHPDWGERRGTDMDAVKMRQVLTNLGFEVRLYQNETEEGFREILAEGLWTVSSLFLTRNNRVLYVMMSVRLRRPIPIHNISHYILS